MDVTTKMNTLREAVTKRADKFTAHDIDGDLFVFTTRTLSDLDASDLGSDFLRDMVAKAATGIQMTDRQVAGTLNCLRFVWRKESAAYKTPEPKPADAAGDHVPDGTYTMKFDGGDYRTLRVKTQPSDSRFAPGKTVISYLDGPDNWSNYRSFAFLAQSQTAETVRMEARLWKKFAGNVELLAAVRVLLGDPLAAAKAYGMASGACAMCGRKLTVPESIEAGIGPVCAAKFG